MVLKHLGDRARFLFVLGLELLEHGSHRARIVAGGPHVLHAEPIGFFFGATAELQKRHTFKELPAVIKNVTDNWTTEQNTREHSVVHHFHLALVFHSMASRNVGDLVRHYAGEFRFVISRQYQTLVDIKESTRQSERINFVG